MAAADPLLSLQQDRPGDLLARRAAGIPVVVEFSGDLLQWHTLTNLPVGRPLQTVTDPGAETNVARFYRVRTP